MNPRENKIRAVRFEKPEYIPVHFGMSAACWHHYDQEALKDLYEAHPLLFPDYVRPEGEVCPNYEPCAIAGVPFTDPWGCVWETTDNGITGTVTKHPLADWADFDSYEPPDPELGNGRILLDWSKTEARVKKFLNDGEYLAAGGLPHGHTFMLLTDIRGYENLIYDMADEDPRLWKLIGMVEDFNMAVINRFIDYGVEYIGYPEDLGMQIGPMVSPDMFRKYIKPSYQRLMKPARDRGLIVHQHSDGDIRDLVFDIIDGGVEVINLQDLVNGIDWIRDNLKGKACIDLDVDRQKVTRFGTPADIDKLIREEVEKLGSPEGGLFLHHGVYPGIPLKNINATMDAFEKYMTYYS